jgi:hypothetical protein
VRAAVRACLGVLYLSGLGVFAGAADVSAPGNPWNRISEASLAAPPDRSIAGGSYAVYRLDRGLLDAVLSQAPLEMSQGAAAPALRLPLPDGSFGRFSVEESPIMEPALAERHPGIRTYRGQGLDDPTATARLGWTTAGFHAIVLSAGGTVYVDPYRRGDTTHYLSYFKRHARRPAGDAFRCLLDEEEIAASPAVDGGSSVVPNGTQLRTYRLALAANFEYSDFHSTAVPPLKADVLNNGIIPTMNRVNGIYERDLAVRMVLVGTEESIIFVAEPDGYTNNNAGQMINANQGIIDNAIGNANYDIGHVFSTGGGGVAGLRVVCGASKARGVTGRGQPVGDPFDVDYVAHEMGHQFGGNHTFNGNEGSCAGGNRNASTAYEVGSGSTIMAYAGICGSQDLQPNSDDDFHVESFAEIVAFITNPVTGGSCPVQTATGNTPPTIDAGAAFSIPSRTPFTLTAAGSDVDGDTLTYDWEEYDLGPAGDGRTDNGSSPILRSFLPALSPSRTFPRLSDILAGTVTYGELLPTTTRTMTFRVTARDNRAGGGGVDFDATTVAVESTAGPFRVSSPNTPITWGAGPQTVAWDVAGTSGAPISTAAVDILLSTDGGLTFPTVLLAGTPNDGSQSVTPPGIATTLARVKVQAVGNVFFDISDTNFSISAVSQLSIGDVVVRERVGTTALATFTVSLSPASAGAVTVSYATASGTATSGSDFVAASGPLAFSAGQTSLPVAVTINPDLLVEGMEIFTVNLSGATGAAISDATGEGRILDAPAGGDFNADALTDLVWRHDLAGENVLWLMNGATLLSGTFTTPPVLADPGWKIVGTNDFNADGRPDLLWRHGGSGQNVLWYMNGSVLTSGTFLTPAALADVNWGMSGTGDFDVDGEPDILWRHAVSGQIVLWYMNGSVLDSGTFTTPSELVDVGWQAVGTGDFNLDGRADILWRHATSGQNVAWYMNGSVLVDGAFLNPPSLPDTGWRMVATGDYNQDGKVDIVWRHSGSGQIVMWFMDGINLVSGTFTTPSTLADPSWKIVGPR